MKLRVLIALILVFSLSGGGLALAHGGDPMAPSTSNLNGGSMPGMDMNGKDKNMKMSGDKSMVSTVTETPPNMKILGTYGAVNLAFIVIGIGNKWFRRKDGSIGNSK